jgi:hypothetical protein
VPGSPATPPGFLGPDSLQASPSTDSALARATPVAQSPSTRRNQRDLARLSTVAAVVTPLTATNPVDSTATGSVDAGGGWTGHRSTTVVNDPSTPKAPTAELQSPGTSTPLVLSRSKIPPMTPQAEMEHITAEIYQAKSSQSKDRLLNRYAELARMGHSVTFHPLNQTTFFYFHYIE